MGPRASFLTLLSTFTDYPSSSRWINSIVSLRRISKFRYQTAAKYMSVSERRGLNKLLWYSWVNRRTSGGGVICLSATLTKDSPAQPAFLRSEVVISSKDSEAWYSIVDGIASGLRVIDPGSFHSAITGISGSHGFPISTPRTSGFHATLDLPQRSIAKAWLEVSANRLFRSQGEHIVRHRSGGSA